MNPTNETYGVATPEERYNYVLKRYDNAIGYYWRASARNKHVYTFARYLIIVIGAAVTLFATLAASGKLNELCSGGRPVSAAQALKRLDHGDATHS